jgi:thioredoxin-dependent peroxiredoxin
LPRAALTNVGLYTRESNNDLQLTAKHKVATPVNWQQGDNVIIASSVSDEEAKEAYPQGWKAPRSYLRVVPQPR